MTMVTFGDSTYTLDSYGFLEHPSFWDEAFAEGMAHAAGIGEGLSGEHWEVISYLRSTYDQKDDVPYFVTACMDLGIRLARFRTLFPTGYMRGALRVSGLSFALINARKAQQTYENLSTIWDKFQLTPLGFLVRHEDWNRTFANLVASEWELPCGITEGHWKVIRFLRERFGSSGAIPTVYDACKINNLSLKDLHTLFPTGYRRGACRMAGLPLEG